MSPVEAQEGPAKHHAPSSFRPCSCCKKTYFSAQYDRLAHKRGKKRAIVAVARSILLTACQMLSRRQHYRELGAGFFDRMEPERLKRYHVKRLETLGFFVTLEKMTEAA